MKKILLILIISSISYGFIFSQGTGNIESTPFVMTLVPGVTLPENSKNADYSLGLIGSSFNNVTGIQVSTIYSDANEVHGIETAAIFSAANNVEGIQVSGIYNIVNESITGLQFGGFFNSAGNVNGVQASGFANISGDFRGVQASGLISIANELTGVQSSVLYNKSGDVKGLQMGLVNVAHEVEGVQIGLINLSNNGVRDAGIFYEPQTSMAYSYWQSGQPYFYTIFGVGTSIDDSFSEDVVLNLGVGTSLTMMDFIVVEANFMAEQPVGNLPFDSFEPENPGSWSGWSMIYPYPTVQLSLEITINDFIKIVTGVKTDVEIGSDSTIPSRLKKGNSFKISLLGEDVTSWSKFFIGVELF